MPNKLKFLESSESLKNRNDLSKKIKMLIAEFIGTACLMFFGCMRCVDWIQMPGLPISASLNFGLTVMFIIQMFGHISFAIINPSVVVAAVVHKLISLKLAVLYVIAQVLGAIFGYGLLKILIPQKHGEELCMTIPNSSVTTVQAFFVEFIITFTLVFVISGAWDPRNKKNTDSIALRIGLTVVALCLASASATGASMNPARSLAPSFWNKNWTLHWLYWIAPMSGSFCACKFYRIFFWCDVEEEEIEIVQDQADDIKVKVLSEKSENDKIDLTLSIQVKHNKREKYNNILDKCDESNGIKIPMYSSVEKL